MPSVRAIDRDEDVPETKEPGDSMIGRVAAILNEFALGSMTLSVSELARRTGLAKSTTSRITRELVEYGYLERVGTELAIGIRLFELGEHATRPRDLKRIAVPRLEQLRRSTGHTVHLAVLEDLEVVYVDILPSRTAPRLPSRIGGRMPAYATAVGKALLAQSDPELVDRTIQAGLSQIGPRTITDPARLRAALAEIAATGIAIERQESSRGSCCVATVVHDRAGAPVASISVSGWDGELDVGQCGAAALAIGRQLTRELASLPPLRRRSPVDPGETRDAYR